MPFDPDAYLAAKAAPVQQTPGFDPDAYLATKAGPTDRPQPMQFDKDHGLLAVLADELVNGHAPNAIEPTTAAQIMAPAVMGGGSPEIMNAVNHYAPAAARAAKIIGAGGLLYGGARSVAKSALKGLLNDIH